MEKLNIAAATKIPAGRRRRRPPASSAAAAPIIQVKSQLPKGTAFVRMCMALASEKGDSYRTLERAKSWHDSTPEVEQMIRAHVAHQGGRRRGHHD